jgi:methyltransferase-like protein/2-polyprenyl-3-methyl-5-hydroxy-6-metoxy-1,4-benzoquinol methylase
MMVELRTHATYDEVPYEGVSISDTHPNRLATMATIFGMSPAPVDRCRVLELACAGGGNLVPMAAGLPNSEFVGIDLSSRQVESAAAFAFETGITNVHFEARNILDVGPDFGQFDYIIAYGVYSWVPPEVQERILGICRDLLAPEGVAFISYNTYPGWHMRGAVRDMLLYHTRYFPEIAERASQARALLQFLQESVAEMVAAGRASLEAYRSVLALESSMLEGRPDYYLIHEHLERENRPCYLHEFVDRLEQHDLHYLGDANFAGMVGADLPPKAAATLAEIAKTNVALEQYRDFITNRMFRQSLICHAGRELERDLRPSILSRVLLRSDAEYIEPGEPGFLPPGQKVRTPSALVVTLATPLAREIASVLQNAAPAALTFDQLLATLPAEFAEGPGFTNRVGAEVLQLFARDVVDLSVYQAPLVTAPGDHPVAHAMARSQAAHGRPLTNLRHQTVDLDAAARFLLPLIDGSRTRDELCEALRAGVASGRVSLRIEGQPEAQDELLPWHFDHIVGRVLNILANAAFLQA